MMGWTGVWFDPVSFTILHSCWRYYRCIPAFFTCLLCLYVIHYYTLATTLIKTYIKFLGIWEEKYLLTRKKDLFLLLTDNVDDDIISLIFLFLLFLLRYYIMRLTWAEKPKDRPEFRQLKLMIEDLLSKCSNYLDLALQDQALEPQSLNINVVNQ